MVARQTTTLRCDAVSEERSAILHLHDATPYKSLNPRRQPPVDSRMGDTGVAKDSIRHTRFMMMQPSIAQPLNIHLVSRYRIAYGASADKSELYSPGTWNRWRLV
jgi:hypothetical protein